MDDNLNDWEKKRKDYLVVGIICFFIGTYFFMKVKSDSYIIKPSDLIVYENLVTTDKPIFKETKVYHKVFKTVNSYSFRGNSKPPRRPRFPPAW